MSGNIRQELYDRIRESSKDEVILEEMVRLGFWPTRHGPAFRAGGLIRRNGELSRELRELYKRAGAMGRSGARAQGDAQAAQARRHGAPQGDQAAPRARAS